MNKENFLILIERIRNGKASEEDIRLYQIWFSKFQEPQGEWDEAEMGNMDEIQFLIKERINQKIGEQLPTINTIRLWPRMTAAASVVLCIVAGSYLISHKGPPVNRSTSTQRNDITSGSNLMILSTNGRKIVLDNGKKGIIARQGNTIIDKKADGTLVYSSAGKTESTGQLQYDTITTPVKGMGSIILSDGSEVWINSASQICYQHTFSGKYRTVQLLYGEACFEVMHNARNPFQVISSGQTIEDIGTFFNVNAYKDEPSVNTTLLEGSINISKGKQSVTLKPGQQAQLNERQLKISNMVDMEQVIAWKNNDFIFNENIESIMRKISRWYDVEVIYQKRPDPTLTFWGEISRKKNISAVLKVIERTNNAHFKLEGRRVIVMP